MLRHILTTSACFGTRLVFDIAFPAGPPAMQPPAMQLSLTPSGLTTSQEQRLTALVAEVSSLSLAEVLSEVESHLREALRLAPERPQVNLALATAIAASISAVAVRWDSLPQHSRPWLLAAMRYFVASDDSEHDFCSLLGFDDDAAVLNACLVLANQEDLLISIDDF